MDDEEEISFRRPKNNKGKKTSVRVEALSSGHGREGEKDDAMDLDSPMKGLSSSKHLVSPSPFQPSSAPAAPAAASAPVTAIKRTKKFVSTFNEEDEEEEIIFTKKLHRNDVVGGLGGATSATTSKSLKYDLATLQALRDGQRKLAAPPKIPVKSQKQQKGLEDHMNGDIDMEEEDEEGGENGFVPSYIPGQAAIGAAKKLREQMRLKAENAEQEMVASVTKSNGGAANYISLTGGTENTVSTFHTGGESRLVTEEQADDEDNAFEDYNASSLAFGSKAVEKARAKLQLERLDMIEDVQNDEQEDEEVVQWELEAIHKGQRSHMEVSLKGGNKKASGSKKKGSLNMAIPPVQAILGSADIINGLDIALQNLQMSLKQYHLQLEAAKADTEASERVMVKLKADSEKAAGRYDYFQDLNSYIHDLVGFLDAKESVVVQLELSYLELLIDELNRETNERWNMLDGIISEIFNVPHGQHQVERKSNLQTEEQLKMEKEESFQDASKHFRKIHHVKDKFDTWKLEHPVEYHDGFGALSLPGIFDLYVRLELLDWSPFKKISRFENMTWHEQLQDFGVEDSAVTDPNDPDTHLLTNIVEKSCIPRLQSLFWAFDIYSGSQCEFAIKAINLLLDYTPIRSPGIQSIFIAVQDQISSQLDLTLEISIPKSPFTFDATPAQASFKRQWLDLFITLMSNVYLWKRFLSLQIIKKWIFEVIIEGMMIPMLETCHNFDLDIEYYSKISNFVKDLIPNNIYETPPEVKFFEVSFLKTIYLKAEKDVSLQRQRIFSQILEILTNIKSFQASSLVTKKLNSLVA